MMNELQEMNEEEKIREFKEQINILQKNMRRRKMNENRKLRLRNNNGKTNILIRVSSNFLKKLDEINDKREENGFDHLSNPKITELIIRHKNCWKKIESDIIYFNTNLDDSEDLNGGFKE